MEQLTSASRTTYSFTSTDSITSTIVAKTSEPTLRIEQCFASKLNREIIDAAIYKLISEEPILSSRLTGSKKPIWIKSAYEPKQFIKTFTSEEEYHSFKNIPVDIEVGPLIQCALLYNERRTLFLIKLAHEVADGFGVKQAAVKIAENYRKLKENSLSTEPSLSSQHASYRSSSQLLSFIPLRALFRLFIIYIKDKQDMFGKGKSVNVSHEIFDEKSPGTTHFSLSKSFTDHLRKTARSLNVNLNDILLTAFLRSMATNSKDPEELYRICMTVNLRRYVENPNQLPISNLSNIECINLKRNLGNTFAETLSKVSAIIQDKKQNWIGLSIIFDLVMQKPLSFNLRKRLHADFVRKTIEKKNTAFLLTNVGRFDAGSLEMEGLPEDLEILGPIVRSPFWNTVVWEFNQAIHFSAGIFNYSQRRHHLNNLYEQVIEELASFSGFELKHDSSKIKGEIA